MEQTIFMFKKSASILCLSLATLILNGCALTPPKGQQEVCTSLKREWVLNSNNINRLSTEQKTTIKQKMIANNCL